MSNNQSTQLIHQLIEQLRAHTPVHTIAFAESCTGGLLSSEMTKVEGISDVFYGGVVSYSYEAKVDLLQVGWQELKLNGAVSEIVANSMAQGIRAKLKTTYGVAITGIAGPSGGTPEKPVGTVWFAAAGPHFVKAHKKVFAGSRIEIQQQSVEFALQFLLDQIRV